MSLQVSICNMKTTQPLEKIAFELPPILIPDLGESQHIKQAYFEKIIKLNLTNLLSDDFLACDTDQQKISYIKNKLPSVSWECGNKLPASFSIRCIYNYRMYSSKFIHDIISRWLIPGKRLNILSTFGSDFSFTQDDSERFIIVELFLSIDSSEDFKTIKKTLPMVVSDIQVGVTHITQGMRILGIKGLNVDDKINLIQESIVSLINQKPDHFNRDLFTEMQRFFVFSQEYFKELREYRHIVRIICWQYLFRRSMHFSS